MKWKNWCQSSINLIGNVIYTPDKEGAGIFFMDVESIPMYPSKPRNLFNKIKIDKNLLLDINKKLQEQSIDYNYFLSKIYLITENNFSYLSDIVYQQWDLVPIKPTDYNDIFSSKNKNETYLILTVQSKSEYSHFVSAQLFSNEEKLMNNSSKKISLERIMEFKSKDFDKEIRKYIEYSGISKRKEFQTWVSKNNQEGIEDIIITYYENNVYFDKKRPVWKLENYYSKPYKNSFLTYLSLVSEVSDISKQDQVLIHFNPDNSGCAVYIRNR
ncbi:hypothetical protein [Proteus mirabilis]|uniref:hypothetical protein n=1 Tax=Proteus mirabilis TaxID=584 RepID=UPI00235E39EA|nr:hypothetical protein [Proteus mirabilis]MDC9769035.1 hypothetical protein [Proteus mirabilis]